MAQSDLRRVVAYVSISHMGVVVLGLCALTMQGMQGGVVQLLMRGLWTGGMLLVVGLVVQRRGTTEVTQFGGLRHVVPGLSAMFLLMTVASIGLPATGTFVGVTRGLAGTLESPVLAYGRVLVVVAVVGVLLWGVAMLRVLMRVVAGPITRDRNRGLRDLTAGEWLIVAPVGVLVVVLGVWPGPLLDLIDPAVNDVIDAVAGIAAPGEP
jgi:NADH-quinone oxidoreductase subunit M